MRRLSIALFCWLTLAAFGVQAEAIQVKMTTSLGAVTIELDSAKAPKSVANFLRYVDEGFYDNTIFHRVIPDFMIQGGGFATNLQQKETHAPIDNEADNGLKNSRGTIAMARTGDPHSATAQFFINHKDNDFLDHSGKTPRGWGYAVFGHVIQGMNVVDKIATTPTRNRGGAFQNTPSSPVIIQSIRRVQ